MDDTEEEEEEAEFISECAVNVVYGGGSFWSIPDEVGDERGEEKGKRKGESGRDRRAV